MSGYAGINQRGLSTVEIMMTLAVMATVMPTVFMLVQSYRSQAQVSKQSYQVQMLATEIKQNAKLIMDAAIIECSQSLSTAYANDGWGWRDPNCQNTSPFPSYNITSHNLVYYLDTANFGSTVTNIINNIGTYCSYVSQGVTNVVFNCSSLGVTGIQYQTASGPTSNVAANTVDPFTVPHTNGTNADFLNFLNNNFPSAVYIQYNIYLSDTGNTIQRNDMTGAPGDPNNGAYMGDMTDLYLDRVKKQTDMLSSLDTALRNYGIGVMTAEFQGAAIGGLASADSFFVPWMWQALASSQSNSLTVCNTTICGNFTSGAQWATAAQTATVPDVWLLLIQNLGLNTTYTIDAWGNPLRISLISNGCVNDVTACSTVNTAPLIPTSGYLAAIAAAGYLPRPSYLSLIVSPLCTANSTFPKFCRWSVGPPN